MPRRGRGVDFAQRFNASRWAEDRLLEAFGRAGVFTVRIGLSEIVPGNVLSDAIVTYKVPDLLAFGPGDLTSDETDLLTQTDLTKLTPQQLDAAAEFGSLVRKARVAIEVEFSPYRAAEMSGRHWKPQPRERIERRARVAETPTPPVAPNIFIKAEDLQPLLVWQRAFHVPIVVVHLFDQEAFAIRLDAVEAFRESLTGDPREDSILQQSRGIFAVVQVYERTDAQGARESKPVFRVTPAAAIKAGNVTGVAPKAQLDLSSSKKYVAQVVFEGGTLVFDAPFLDLLRDVRALPR